MPPFQSEGDEGEIDVQANFLDDHHGHSHFQHLNFLFVFTEISSNYIVS